MQNEQTPFLYKITKNSACRKSTFVTCIDIIVDLLGMRLSYIAILFCNYCYSKHKKPIEKTFQSALYNLSTLYYDICVISSIIWRFGKVFYALFQTGIPQNRIAIFDLLIQSPFFSFSLSCICYFLPN